MGCLSICRKTATTRGWRRNDLTFGPVGPKSIYDLRSPSHERSRVRTIIEQACCFSVFGTTNRIGGPVAA